MPPKVKVTKKEIIEKAFSLVKEQGMDAMNARSIAASLGCSTQPIFSNFDSMESLEQAVIEMAEQYFESFCQTIIQSDRYPQYKAYGIAYIAFATKEKHLFSLLYMRDRSGELTSEKTRLFTDMSKIVQGQLGMEENRADIFHLEIWAVVHGIACMIVTGFWMPDEELISKMVSDVYIGLKKRFEEKE